MRAAQKKLASGTGLPECSLYNPGCFKAVSLSVLQMLPHKWEPSQLPTTPGLLKDFFVCFPPLKNQYERRNPKNPLGLSVEKWEEDLKVSKVEFLDATKIHIVEVNEV